MKVRIAVQTLSKSVSDALMFVAKDLGLPQFQNVDATCRFLKIFNDIFDILNSRNIFAKYDFKKPLSEETAPDFFAYMKYVEDYILNLSLGGSKILETTRKIGFLGFLVCIESLRGLYECMLLINST